METLFTGKRFSVVRNGTWQYTKHYGSVAILPVLHTNQSNEEIILVRQYRPPAGQFLLEAPAGAMDVEGETHKQCASRELIEETGYEAGVINGPLSVYMSPGVSDERIHLFIGSSLEYKGKIENKEEITETVIISTGQALNEIGKSIIDAKTIILLMMLAYQSGFDS
jgi:ADP-ribose pyrophosphatase